MARGLDTGGFQVRRLPQHQPMDPRLFVEQPIQLGNIAREGLEGFNRGRQMAAEDELRQARLAQLEQQMAQNEQMAPLEQQQAQARLGGLEQQSRLQELQLQEAAQQQALAEEGRRTVEEILEEGTSEDFEGFEDETRERIFDTARMAQVIDGTTGIPSQETFRAVSQMQFESQQKTEGLVPTQGQEPGEDGTYIDPSSNKPFIQVDGQMFTSRSLDSRFDPAQGGGSRTGGEQIIPVPTEARRQIRQALDDWQDLEDQSSETSSPPGAENQVKRRLRRYVNQYGRASIEEQGLLLPEDLDLEFNTEDLPDDIQEMYDTSPPEVKEMIEREWEEGDLDNVKEQIELQNRKAGVENELEALYEERNQGPIATAIGSAGRSGVLSGGGKLAQAMGILPEKRRSTTVIDTEIAKKQKEKREIESALWTEEEKEDIMGEYDPIEDFNENWMNRQMGGANVPSQ